MNFCIHIDVTESTFCDSDSNAIVWKQLNIEWIRPTREKSVQRLNNWVAGYQNGFCFPNPFHCGNGTYSGQKFISRYLVWG